MKQSTAKSTSHFLCSLLKCLQERALVWSESVCTHIRPHMRNNNTRKNFISAFRSLQLCLLIIIQPQITKHIIYEVVKRQICSFDLKRGYSTFAFCIHGYKKKCWMFICIKHVQIFKPLNVLEISDFVCKVFEKQSALERRKRSS